MASNIQIKCYFCGISDSMVTLVVAMGKNNAIGKENLMPWHLPNDLQHFKRLTLGHPVIMGRKTYESIGKALPGRTNIVISRRDGWFQEGILIVGSLKEAMKFAQKIDDEIFIIGGGEIFRQTIEAADRLEVTEVEASPDADVFFPKIDPKIWGLVKEEHHTQDDRHAYDYTFKTYERLENI